MSILRKIIFVISIAGVFFAVPNVHAHRPEEALVDGVTEIPDPKTSFAYYRDFDTGRFLHLYSVSGTAGTPFHAGIQIPQIDGLENYGVTLGLFGPGLPEIDLRSLSLPSTIEAGPVLEQMGGIIAPTEITEDFYEPFTQTRYWGRQSLDIQFPETGEYYLVIWQADEFPGKYVLDTGRAEVFSPGDLLRFPIWWWNTRAYFNQLPSFSFTSVVLGLLLLGVISIRRRAYQVG